MRTSIYMSIVLLALSFSIGSVYAEDQTMSIDSLYGHTTTINLPDKLVVLNGDNQTHALKGLLPNGAMLNAQIASQNSVTIAFPGPGNYTFEDNNNAHQAFIVVIDPTASLTEKVPVINDSNHSTPLQLNPVSIGLSPQTPWFNDTNSTTNTATMDNSSQVSAVTVTTTDTTIKTLTNKIDTLNAKIDALQTHESLLEKLLSQIASIFNLK